MTNSYPIPTSNNHVAIESIGNDVYRVMLRDDNCMVQEIHEIHADVVKEECKDLWNITVVEGL